MSRAPRKKTPKVKQYRQFNHYCASTPSLVRSISHYVDLHGKQHDIEQTGEVENMQNTLYTLKIKSHFFLNMTNVELNHIYPVVMEIVKMDENTYMINKKQDWLTSIL